MPGDVVAPALPAPARGRRRWGSPVQAEPVDPGSGEAEERRQQRDRGDHHDQHDDRDGDAAGGHERDAGDGQAEDGDDHGAAGEDHGLPGGGHRPPDRLLDRQSPREVLAVPGDEEQRVVDADAEADHAAQHGRPAGDLDQVGDQRQRADPEGEPEHRHPDRQSHRDDRAERHEQDDDRGDQAEDLADPGLRLLEREEQVPAHLDPQRRVRGGRGAVRLQPLQVRGVQPLDDGVLHLDHRDPAVRRERGSAGADHVRQRGRARHARRTGRPRHRRRRAWRRRSFGVRTSCAVSPARADAVGVSSSVACWESVPGTAKESSSFFPKALLAASTSTTSSTRRR